MFRKLDGAAKADAEDTKLDVLFYRMPRSEGITKNLSSSAVKASCPPKRYSLDESKQMNGMASVHYNYG